MYLLKRVMHQFGYLQIIPRPPHDSISSTVPRKYLQAILDNFESHLVLEEYHREPTHVYWTCVKGYMTWLYRLSHPIITPDTLGEPPRPTNQEVLEIRDEQLENMETVCWRVVEMGRDHVTYTVTYTVL
ncbi:uncharacterized protein LOC131636367 [Vicia villosa]|uniref:uncharacterized protein LOC131636367 n=1 Tax=Vicia villosa TaxID=3911 RepID=UPI00273BA429|nr:uncharacterized protein LOC131636367 [Vicia villosa]